MAQYCEQLRCHEHAPCKRHPVRVVLVPMFSDNYAYLLIDTESKTCAVVDPAEPARVFEALKREKVTLSHVLTTHNHPDHAGGNGEMKKTMPSLQIIGGVGDGAEAVTQEVKQGDTVVVGSLAVRVLSTPCHTPGHVCYYVEAKGDSPPMVFTGDTMFVGGCGNFNKGTPAQMYNNMCKVLGSLPPETLVYCGHEYTVKNLMFGLYAEPDNEAIKQKLLWAKDQRKANLPTVPSSIGAEWATNPFMRLQEESIQRFTGKSDPAECILAVRQMKDEWGKKAQL